MKKATINAFLIALFVTLTALAQAADKPNGKFLFQPMFIWGTSEVSHQGTGYLLKDGDQTLGVTSIHFLNFEAGGLFEAIWLDINTSRPVIDFRESLGRPKVSTIEEFKDIAHDFLVMPTDKLPEGYSAIEIEDVPKYQKGHKLWFPNKTSDEKLGYKWVEAEVLSDDGFKINVKLLSAVKLQSQSGTPFFSQETGKAIGMLMGGEVKELYLCPTRSISKHLRSKPELILLIKSITKG